MNKYIIFAVVAVVVGGFVLLQFSAQEPANPESTPANAEQQASTNDVPSDNIYKTATDASKGAYLTDFQGMTLYTFDNDTEGVSNCDGECLKKWPVYTSGATAQGIFPKNITVIKRADGSEQFAWKGKPLYYYASDQKAGDISGDGVGGVWHIVTP